MKRIHLTESQFRRVFNEKILLEYRNIGVINANGLIYIDVLPKEGQYVPHFHVFNEERKKGKRIDTCLSLEEAKYFRHGMHKTFLTNKQIDLVYNFLMSECKNPDQWPGDLESGKPSQTNYEVCVNQWNNNFKDIKIIKPNWGQDGKMIIPDYRNLKV